MRLLSLIALVPLLSAQTPEEKTFRLQSAATNQDFQEVATAALVMSDLATAKSSDVVQREFSVSGAAEQIRAAEWVVRELDRPPSSTPLPASALYTFETKQRGNEDTMRVFYPAQISSTQDLNEVSTAIRTISDIRRVAVYVSYRAMVVRGTREQVDFVEWLLAELNRDSPQETFVYPKTGDPDNQVRVFRYVRAPEVQTFNEVQTMIRTLTDTRRVYPYIGKRAIAMRGSVEQLDMAQWILAQLEKDLPLAQKTTSGNYATKSGDVVKMFYFTGATNQQAFLETGTAFRTATGIRRFYPFTPGRTLAARGTPAQIAQLAAFASQ